MFSTKGRYALRVMADLATQDKDRFVPLNEIAIRQDISLKYLETILKSLVQANLLVGHRGKNGGYKLTRTPSEYTVGEILELTEGSLSSISCHADGPDKCPRINECSSMPMWTRFDKMVHDFFYGITLEEVISENYQNI